ncbi:MAG: sulfotransferase domain-containing protein [Longimicrobiaceae bacterium]
MHRIRPRKILGACVGSVASLAMRIDNAVLTPWQIKLRLSHRRLLIRQYGLEYDGSPDDIFIVTYPKSGTTWLQMIVYQLTTDGAMDFPHIDQVSPFLEITMIPRRLKISDLRATPRVVKSHLSYREIPKGPGRYIYGVRNGLDVAVSYYYHARKYLRWGPAPLGEFFSRFIAGEVPYGSWFEHVAGWLRNEDRLNVLVVTYEELSADLEAGVKRIADFCGITIDPAAMPRILERCSFAFMREHDARFAIQKGGPLPAPASPEPPFIRQGQVGGWRQELDARAMSDFQEACDRRLRDLGEDMVRVLSGRGAREGEPAL